jgi:hypothetical protein
MHCSRFLFPPVRPALHAEPSANLLQVAWAQCERCPERLLPHSAAAKTWIGWAAGSHSGADRRTGWSVPFSPALWRGKITMPGLSFSILAGMNLSNHVKLRCPRGVCREMRGKNLIKPLNPLYPSQP